MTALGPEAGRRPGDRPGDQIEHPLVLASASPRRRELLGLLGVGFEVVEPAVEEISEGDAEEVVVANAVSKAADVRSRLGPARPVLGADTDVLLDGELLGKPADQSGAAQRLRRLAGRTHEVLSGVALLPAAQPEAEPQPRTALARTRVSFEAFDESLLEIYLASGEWRGRAGAYAVQGLGSVFVKGVEGDLSNVIGLPLRAVLQLLGAAPPGARSL